MCYKKRGYKRIGRHGRMFQQTNKDQLKFREYKFSFNPRRWNAEFKFIGFIEGLVEVIDIKVKQNGFRSITLISNMY